MKNKFFSKTITVLGLFSFLLMVTAAVPSLVSAQTTVTGSSDPTAQGGSLGSSQNFQLVPCQGAANSTVDPTTQQASTPCDFAAFMVLIQRGINFLLYAAIFIATLSIVYAGFEYLTAGGDTSKVKKAHEIFKVTVIGFAIALCSWLVVYTVITAVINPAFTNVMFLQKQ